jgi:hypothetical protein
MTRRRLALVGSVLLGVALGRLLLPRLEVQTEITAIVRTNKDFCSFATSTTESLLGQPLYLIDGGEIVKCGERRRLSSESFVYCECE